MKRVDSNSSVLHGPWHSLNLTWVNFCPFEVKCRDRSQYQFCRLDLICAKCGSKCNGRGEMEILRTGGHILDDRYWTTTMTTRK